MIDSRFFKVRENGLSIDELCALLDIRTPAGTFGEVRIFKPADLAGSVRGDITFLESKRHLRSLETAQASACFVSEKFASDVAARNIIPLVCRFSKFQLARATELLVLEADFIAPTISTTADVHPTAIIGQGVVIGDDVKIGANSVVTNALIGSGTNIGACTVIGGAGFGVASGPNGAIMSVPHIGRVVIGACVRIGSNSCIDRGQLGDTRIGDNCKIDNLVQIAHNCILEEGCILAGRVGVSGSCHIGKGVMMGGSAGLADHITVGEGARLAAFAGVMHDIPAGETWSGIPAMPIRDHMRIVARSKRDLRK